MLNYTFDWSVLWRQPYGAMMLKGIWTTLSLSLAAWCVAVFLGILIAALRVYPGKTSRALGTAYVLIFRNIPFLVQLFFWYFAAPLLLPRPVQAWVYDTIPDYAFWCGVAGLGMYTASRVAEQFRAGLLAIPEDQYRAAYATGLRPYQAYRYVILPYAFRIIIPAFTTEFLTCFKNSALTMTIGVMEITHTAYVIDSFTWHGLETTTAASLCYLAIAQAVALLMWRVEKKWAVPGLIRRGGMMEFGVIADNLGYMAGGLWLTLEIAALAVAGGLAWGIVLGLCRLSPVWWIYYPASLYIHFFRGIPLILVIFWIYFLVPVFLGRSLGQLPAVVLSFVLYEAAYFAEIVRSGIQAVPEGQKRAGLATGLLPRQIALHVVLPQAMKKMVPALVTHCVVVFQDTSLAYVIGLREFLRRVNLVDAREARSVELYLFAACVYFILCTLGSVLGQYLERRPRVKDHP